MEDFNNLLNIWGEGEGKLPGNSFPGVEEIGVQPESAFVSVFADSPFGKDWDKKNENIDIKNIYPGVKRSS